MGKLTVRPLTVEDLIEGAKVIQKSLLVNLKSQGLSENTIQDILGRYTPDNFAEIIKDKIFFLCEDENGKIIGVGGLKKDEGSTVYNRLTNFFVDPEYQGQGAGKLLYEKVKDEAKKQDCTKLVVNSSPEAELFYEHLGFKKIKIISKAYPNGNKHNTIWMEQKL